MGGHAQPQVRPFEDARPRARKKGCFPASKGGMKPSHHASRHAKMEPRGKHAPPLRHGKRTAHAEGIGRNGGQNKATASGQRPPVLLNPLPLPLFSGAGSQTVCVRPQGPHGNGGHTEGQTFPPPVLPPADSLRKTTRPKDARQRSVNQTPAQSLPPTGEGAAAPAGKPSQPRPAALCRAGGGALPSPKHSFLSCGARDKARDVPGCGNTRL